MTRFIRLDNLCGVKCTSTSLGKIDEINQTNQRNQIDQINDIAEKEFGFKAKTTLEEGLKKTIKWYKDKKGSSPN